MKATSGLSALARLGGMGLALAALPAGAQQMTCDSNSDGMVHATEAVTCAAQRFDEAAAGHEEMTQEQSASRIPMSRAAARTCSARRTRTPAARSAGRSG